MRAIAFRSTHTFLRTPFATFQLSPWLLPGKLSGHDCVMPILYSLLTAPWKVCFENLSPPWPWTSTHTPRQTLEFSLYYTYTRINSLPATLLCFTFSAHCQECQVFACACVCVCHSLCVMPIAHQGGIQYGSRANVKRLTEGSPDSILVQGLRQKHSLLTLINEIWRFTQTAL